MTPERVCSDVRLASARLHADGRVRLHGFAHATLETSQDELRDFCGSPCHASPEMARSDPAPWSAIPLLQALPRPRLARRGFGRALPTVVRRCSTVAYEMLLGTGPFSDAEATSATNFTVVTVVSAWQ